MNYTPNKITSEIKKHGICVSDGNTKLSGIHSFSLPSIETCPGKTSLCSKLCYAAKYEKRYKSTNKAYHRNWKLLQNDMSFVEEKLDEFLQEYGGNHRYFRIHVAGDFYSPEYTKMWLRLIERHDGIKFTAYTRSWRETNILPILTEMNELSNMRLFYSTDKETGQPKDYSVATAYLMEDDLDTPKSGQSLVFRNKTKTVMTKVNNAILVCPYENGITKTKKMTCQRCLVCYK